MIKAAKSRLEKTLDSEQFTYGQLKSMYLTLVLDQFFIVFILVLSTAMVSSTGEAAIAATNMLARQHGILAGISAGANYHAAAAIAARHPARTVVTILPDSGMRYLSSDLFGA